MISIGFLTDGLESSINLTEKLQKSLLSNNSGSMNTPTDVEVHNHMSDKDIPEELVELFVGEYNIPEGGGHNAAFLFTLDEDTITNINAEIRRGKMKIIKSEDIDNG